MPKKVRSNSFENIFVSESHRAIYNEISYLKKRIHLVEGEKRANYESNEEFLKKNKEKIVELKGKIAIVKDELKAKEKTKDFFHLISPKWENDKKAFIFKGKSYEQTTEILEDKNGDLKNKKNLVVYEKKQLVLKLDQKKKEAKKHKEYLERERSGKGDEDPRITEIKSTENGIALMQMKITEAENIRVRYKAMTETIKTENFNKALKIKQLEKEIENQEKEKMRIRQIIKNAKKAKMLGRKQLTEIEKETTEEYGIREGTLYESRLKLKDIRDKMELIGGKLSFPKFHMAHRDSSLTGGVLLGIGDLGLIETEGKGQNQLEDIYFRLRDMTGESDPRLIVSRFQEQRNHAVTLAIDEGKIQSEVRKVKLRKRFLEDKLNQLKYSGGQRREKLDKKLQHIEKEIIEMSMEKDGGLKSIETIYANLDQIAIKLMDICKENELHGEVDPENTGTHILQMLNFILERIELIVEEKEIELVAQSKNPSPVEPPIPTDRYGSENELSLISGTSGSRQRFGSQTELSPTEGARSLIEIVSLSLPDFLASEAGGGMSKGGEIIEEKNEVIKSIGKRDESSEEEEPVTRNFIKRQSQILVEAKTRNKGRFNASNNTPTNKRR